MDISFLLPQLWRILTPSGVGIRLKMCSYLFVVLPTHPKTTNRFQLGVIKIGFKATHGPAASQWFFQMGRIKNRQVRPLRLMRL